MFCSSCGVALPQRTKFCNRCGAKLTKKNESKSSSAEDAFGEYLDGLFWTAFWGLGVIIGGIVILKKALELDTSLIIAYAVVSSLAFAVVYALTLWKTLHFARLSREERRREKLDERDTNKLAPGGEQPVFQSTPSVVETTTRNLETSSRERLI